MPTRTALAAISAIALIYSHSARADECQEVRDMVAWCRDTEQACASDPNIRNTSQCQSVKSNCPSYYNRQQNCGAGAGAASGGGANDGKAAIADAVNQTLEMGKARAEQAAKELDRVAESLEKLRYESALKRVAPGQRLGHSDESLDDIVDDEPAAPPPPIAYPRKPGDEEVEPAAKKGAPKKVESRIVLEPARAIEDASCPDGTFLTTFSCRLKSPAKTMGCKPLHEGGFGAECLGATMCCLAARERNVVLAASKACPIRRCPGASANPALAEQECPASDGATCDYVEKPYPSLAHCSAAKSADPPPPAPGGLWSGAACRSFWMGVGAWAKKAGTRHDADRAARQSAEAQGAELPCPHGCDHGAGFKALEAAFNGVRAAAQARLREGIPACEQALRQVEVTSGSLAFDTGYRGQVLNGWAPPDPDDGPYGTWSQPVRDYEIAPEMTRNTLCAALDAAERCR